ncbi:MAG: hypothetical protein GY861_18430 [bacterium]|nr:hypothetical protein [bacterium]
MPNKDPFVASRIEIKKGKADAGIYMSDGTSVIDKDGNVDAPVTSTNLTLSGTLTVAGASQFNSTVTVGVDDTGYDVKLFGATASQYWLWDESADKMIIAGDAAVTGTTTLVGPFDLTGKLDTEDTQDGGASNGNIVKKTLQAGEAYTGTTAGLMVKNYCADGTVTVPSGEFTGLYINVKGLHTSPGNNASLISAHVHGSNTTVIHAGLWLYGDMTNGVKMSGSTLTSLIDGSEVTAVSNLANLKAATDGAVEASVATPAGNTTHCMRILIDGSTPGYIPVYAAKSF